MRSLIFIVLFLSAPILNAQWVQHFVNENATMPQKLLTGLIDSDDNVDIVVLEQANESFFWYKNLDGQGTYSAPIEIGSINEPRNIALGFIDSDNAPDLLVSTPASTPPNLAWFENDAGANGHFGFISEISTPLTEEEGALAIADLNGDNDNDIITVGGDNKLVWYENMFPSGTFGSPNIVIENYVNSGAVAIGDVDGDGDADICVGSSASGRVAWFKNLDGQGNFSAPIEFGQMSQAIFRVKLADLDDDGDLDLIGGGFINVVWWENTDGQGTFSDDVVIDPTPGSSIFPVDLDNDGDLDLLRAVSDVLPNGRVEWFENLDGLGTFGSAQLIDNLHFPSSIAAADIDNDGDMDPITLSSPSSIIWYENNLLGIQENDYPKVEVYPNPTVSFLTIRSETRVVLVTIYDSLGRTLHLLKDDFDYIDTAGLSQGVYLLKIETEYGSYSERIIKN